MMRITINENEFCHNILPEMEIKPELKKKKFCGLIR
jgi:hypothetical protein